MKKRVTVLAILLLAVASLAIADDDDEEPQFLPGLVANYSAPGGECRRCDDAVQFIWNDRSPDERLPPGDFAAEWRGLLQVLSPGTHRFYLYAAGEVWLEVGGKQILSGHADSAQWFDSPAVELEFGEQPIAVRFKKTSKQARIGLYWSGPQFELEPLPGRVLLHAPSDEPGDAFERGAELWRALRCANCHRADAEMAGMAGPSLTNLPGNVSREWLVKWLMLDGSRAVHEGPHPGPPPEGEGVPRRMPQFGMTGSEAQAVADYLLAGAQTDPSVRPSSGDAGRGRQLFLTLGCLACHRVGDVGTAGLFGGGDLTHIADKRPADFFARWLAEPTKINADHRMPVFKLSDSERIDLATWLSTLHEKPLVARNDEKQSDAERGRAIVESLRCRACHALPAEAEPKPLAFALKLTSGKDWRQTCLDAPNREHGRPGYVLPPRDRNALLSYLNGRQQRSRPADGHYVLRERNCLACHARDNDEGIAAGLTGLIEQEPGLAPILPTLAPPALTSVGDKLHDAALADAIGLRNPPLRPWLAVRMPKFNLSPDELNQLTKHLTTIDRLPPRPRTEPKIEPKPLVAAGSRLVTAAGFGCTSCHKIGSSLPSNVALAARGTDLSTVGKRIRREWFDRWVRNPARIVPRMEMPAIQIPVRGVLSGKLDAQLAAVWHVLNTPGFEPPPSGPVRIARHMGDDSPPMVITDVTEIDKQVVVRPVMIGLKNRHNLLFDLGANRLLAWWLGDTANQQTRGKGWYWEPAAANLLSADKSGQGELQLVAGERTIAASPFAGDSLADFDGYETCGDAVVFRYRLKFVDGDDTFNLRVAQQFVPERNGRWQGFRRRWEIAGVPPGFAVRLRYAPKADSEQVTIQSDTIDGKANGEGFVVLRSPSGDGSATFETIYVAAADPPAPAASPPPPVAEAAAKLAVVPGYEAVRLPLPRSEMPTGLAWRGNGTFAFCSLKGGVWLAYDTDGDGLEDDLKLAADGLPAPYGIACDGVNIDVAAKYGIVRLAQLDKSGRARRADVIASGWGYTADYHDWTIGLPRDAAGNYYVGLPCQQDDRSPAEAFLRGTVVRLRPVEPTPERPRLFDLDPLAAGIRFPMGLAIDRGGEIFVTDNQGNYNPFNELNHVIKGARYGFINKLEVKPGFQPPFEDPAIAIPHPWTRSVNGICFLDGPDRFGPFEGHLIGCEFDTRRLVRMSLEKVDDTYQGAAYPFSTEPAPGEPTFEGPVVCAVSSDGELYVGNLRDSGWGGGQNTGSIVRVRPSGKLPVGIAEVRARHDGFAIDFTAPVDRARATETANYSASSYRRITTPAYGGPDVDRESESIVAVELSPDGRQATLHLKRMRVGFVYELQLKNLAGEGRQFFPAEAHYTLRKVP